MINPTLNIFIWLLYEFMQVHSQFEAKGFDFIPLATKHPKDATEAPNPVSSRSKLQYVTT